MVCFCLLTFGQDKVDSVQYYPGNESAFNAKEIESHFKNRKLRFNLELGTSFGASNYGSYFGTYVAPHFTFPLNHRFSLSAGGYFTGISTINHTENAAVFGSPYGAFFTRSFIYIEGAYRLNENLTITGTAYKEIDLFNPGHPSDPCYNFDTRGFIMGVDYKIGDHVFIRGQVEISNGRSPYHSSPFLNPAGNRMRDPFFYNP